MKTTIQISKELQQKLKLLAVCKSANYENMLEELVENYLDDGRNKIVADLIKKSFEKKENKK